MKLDKEKLEDVLRRGDAAAVAKFFRGASEAERQSVAQPVQEWCELLELNWRASFNRKAAERLAPKDKIKNPWPLEAAANLAALACLSLAQIKALLRGERPDLKLIADVLRDRRPEWLDDYAEFLCGGDLHRWTSGDWKQVRYLVREGLCRPPKHDNYVLGAINGIWPPFNLAEQLRRKDAGLDPLPEPNLADLLLTEKDWLEDSFWRLFEIEGTGEVSLANGEKYGRSPQTWSGAIAELSRRGILSRERLLDASLAALARDYIQFRAGWFSRFHETMLPTVAEREKRLPAYFQLLGSAIPPTVTFALKAIQTLDKEKPIAGAQLARHLESALAARSKVAVTGALQLLDRAARREKSFANHVARLATVALLHESTEVQAAALDLIERHPSKDDTELRAKLSELAEHIAPSLRKRLDLWLEPGKVSAKATVAPTVLPAARLSRLDPSRAITPIQGMDELILCASAVLESPDDPMEIERVLDGLSRLGTQRPRDFAAHVGPLRKRSLQRRGADATRSATLPLLHRGLAMLFATWTSGTDQFTRAFRQDAQVADEIGFVLHRLVDVGDALLAGRTHATWSISTHVGGWIDPAMLVQRAIDANVTAHLPDLREQVLALLRLAPERRDEALSRAGAIPGEFGDALRFALGDSKVKIGATAALWVAAARSRDAYGNFPGLGRRHHDLGPDAAIPAQYQLATRSEPSYTHVWGRILRKPAMPRRVPPEHLTVLMHLRKRDLADGALLRWLGTLCPGLRESFFAHGFHPLFHMCDVDHDSVVYLEPLADPFTELRTMARIVMAIGLALKEANYRGIAMDGFINALETGRMRPAEFGETLGLLVATGNFPAARWVKSFSQIARVSREHRVAVAAVIEHSLRGDPAKAPRDIHAMLELFVELLAEIGGSLNDPQAREYLRGIATGGRTAKLVKQLLAVVTENDRAAQGGGHGDRKSKARR